MSLWRKILLVYMLAHQVPNTLNGQRVDSSLTPTRTPTAKSVPTRTAALSLSSNLKATPTATPTPTPTATPPPTRKAATIPKATPTPKPKPKLRCFLCFSDHSWEDCDEKSKVVNCPPGFDEDCIKMTQKEWEKKNGNKTGKVLTRYMKYCGTSEQCSDTQCRKIGWQCTVDCCTEDLCNSNGAVLGRSQQYDNIITLILIAVLGLAAVP